MIDPLTNFSGLVNILFGAIVTVLEIFFGPVLSVVVSPLLQILNATS